MELSELRLKSCGISSVLEKDGIGCGNSELIVLLVLAKFIG